MPFTGTVPTLGALHVPTVSELAGITDPLKEITLPWSSYAATITAATTNPTFGSTVGSFIQVGKFIVFHANFVFATAGSGIYTVSLPVTSNEGTGSPIGVATCAASSGAVRLLRSAWQNGNLSVALAAEDGTRVTNAVPFAFSSGAIISVKGVYEAA